MEKEYKKLYSRAREFLIAELGRSAELDRSDAESILNEYACPSNPQLDNCNISDVYKAILASAQNTNMKPAVIKAAIGEFDALSKVLFNFDPHKTHSKYGDDSNKLLEDIEQTLIHPRGKKISKAKRGIWPKFCRTILSAAAFLKHFKDANNFKEWTQHFYEDERSRAVLPLLISEEVYGVGYALACDFLKEFGFVKYGKPDVHVIDILVDLDFCKEDASLYSIQKTISAVAKANEITPYCLDKILWLIGSGKFYRHSDTEDNKGQEKKYINIGGKKGEFIKYYKELRGVSGAA